MKICGRIIMLFCLFLSCSPGEQKSVATEKNIGEIKFVLSCGGGCALIFREQKISKKIDSFEILFHVTTMGNNKKRDEYKITYLLKCNKNNIVVKLKGKSIEKTNPVVQMLLENYPELCMNISQNRTDEDEVEVEVECSREENLDEYWFKTTCIFKKANNITKLYEIWLIQDNRESMLNTLPKNDTMITDDSHLSLTYNFTKEKLLITEQFQGGQTELIFYMKGQVGIVEEINYPD